MAEQHKKVFKALGMPNDLIEKLETLDAEGLKDFKTDEYTGPITGVYKSKLINDDEFLQTITVDKLPATVKKAMESGQYERFIKELEEVVTKEWGLDINNIPEADRRKLKDYFRKANALYVEKNGGDNKEAIKTMQTQLQKALGEKSDMETKHGEALTKATGDTQAKYVARLQEMAGVLKISGITGLKVKPEYALGPAMGKMRAKYNVVFDEETNDFVLKQKANPLLDVLDEAGKSVSFESELTNILKADNMIEPVKDPKQQQQQQQQEIHVNGGAGTLPSYIQQKIDAGLKEESASA